MVSTLGSKGFVWILDGFDQGVAFQTSFHFSWKSRWDLQPTSLILLFTPLPSHLLPEMRILDPGVFYPLCA